MLVYFLFLVSESSCQAAAVNQVRPPSHASPQLSDLGSSARGGGSLAVSRISAGWGGNGRRPEDTWPFLPGRWDISQLLLQDAGYCPSSDAHPEALQPMQFISAASNGIPRHRECSSCFSVSHFDALTCDKRLTVKHNQNLHPWVIYCL